MGSIRFAIIRHFENNPEDVWHVAKLSDGTFLSYDVDVFIDKITGRIMEKIANDKKINRFTGKIAVNRDYVKECVQAAVKSIDQELKDETIAMTP